MAKKGVDLSQYGKWAFLVGGLIAIVQAFYAVPYAAWIFAIAGVLIGLANIKDQDAAHFLIVVIALTVASVSNWLGVVPGFGSALNAIVNNVVALLSPAALVVALRSAYTMTKR